MTIIALKSQIVAKAEVTLEAADGVSPDQLFVDYTVEWTTEDDVTGDALYLTEDIRLPLVPTSVDNDLRYALNARYDIIAQDIGLADPAADLTLGEWAQQEGKYEIEPPNLVPNPGAEVDASGWSTFGTATIARVTSPVKKGVGAFEVVLGGAGDNGVFTAAIPIDDDAALHRLKMWVNVPAGHTLKWGWNDDISGAPRYSVAGIGDWDEVMSDDTPAAGSTTLTLFIFSTADAFTAQFDDVRLYEVP